MKKRGKRRKSWNVRKTKAYIRDRMKKKVLTNCPPFLKTRASFSKVMTFDLSYSMILWRVLQHPKIVGSSDNARLWSCTPLDSNRYSQVSFFSPL